MNSRSGWLGCSTNQIHQSFERMRDFIGEERINRVVREGSTESRSAMRDKTPRKVHKHDVCWYQYERPLPLGRQDKRRACFLFNNDRENALF